MNAEDVEDNLGTLMVEPALVRDTAMTLFVR